MLNFTNVSQEFNLEVWSNFLEDADIRMEVISVAITCFVFVASLSGNLLTCIVIYYDKSMHTVTNYYLFILAVSDLVLTFTMTFAILEQVTGITYRQYSCKMQWFMSISSWNYSILTMTALSIERYVAVCYPLSLKSKPVSRRVLKVMVLMSLAAMLETAPELFTVDIIKTRQSSICFTIPTRFARILNGVLALSTFFIPLIIMIFAYSMIMIKVNAKPKKDVINKNFNYRSPRGKVNTLIIMMTVSFLVCGLPFFVTRVMIATLDVKELGNATMVNTEKKKMWTFLFQIMSMCTWFCVMLNPMVFSLGSTKFRNSLKALWRSKIRRLETQNEDLRRRCGTVPPHPF